MAVSVAIVFSVRLVVLVAVGDQIPQREAVMRGDEIDACGGAASVVAEDLARSGDALGQRANADFAR